MLKLVDRVINLPQINRASRWNCKPLCLVIQMSANSLISCLKKINVLIRNNILFLKSIDNKCFLKFFLHFLDDEYCIKFIVDVKVIVIKLQVQTVITFKPDSNIEINPFVLVWLKQAANKYTLNDRFFFTQCICLCVFKVITFVVTVVSYLILKMLTYLMSKCLLSSWHSTLNQFSTSNLCE